MREMTKIFVSVALAIGMIFLSACSPVDTSSEETTQNVKTPEYKYKDIVPPEISSDDRVMSVFFDITYYNVENYSEIYLGERFKISGEFDGIKLSIPSDYNALVKSGFTLSQDSEYNSESVIYAGDKQFLNFLSPDGHTITAEFYNSSAKSVKLSECTLVKYQTDAENAPLLSANGISGSSSLSEAITKLGYPSHFHKEDNGLYSLDYFLGKKDLRDRITLYADPAEDTVTSISFCKYTKYKK